MNKKNLILRILSSLVMIPIVIMAVYLGHFYFLGLISVISLLAIIELNGFVKSRNNYLNSVVVSISNLFILYGFYSGIEHLIVLGIVSYFLFIGLLTLFSVRNAAFERISYHLFALFYVSICLGTMIYLRENFHLLYDLSYSTGSSFIILVLINIWLSDIFAYFGGSLFGKHKLYQAVSPNKTIEGSIIGFIISVSISTIAFQFYFQSFSFVFILAITSLIALATQIGDLFESKLKRDLSVKDSGSLIPGHGGILDRIDSILFVFPTIFVYLELQSFFR